MERAWEGGGGGGWGMGVGRGGGVGTDWSGSGRVFLRLSKYYVCVFFGRAFPAADEVHMSGLMHDSAACKLLFLPLNSPKVDGTLKNYFIISCERPEEGGFRFFSFLLE